jgi:hypothetical protein
MIPRRTNDGTSARADDGSGSGARRTVESWRGYIRSGGVASAASIGTAVPAYSASARDQCDRGIVIAHIARPE